MKDQRTSYSAKDKRSSAQQICVLDVTTILLRKNGPIRLALVGLMAGWLAGRQNAGKNRIIKILYRLNYSNFCYI